MIIKLVEYAENGSLHDLEDAKFFARKFGAEDQLDFSGVHSIEAEYLDVLLAGNTLESLDERIVSIEEGSKVDQALMAWSERQQDKPVPDGSGDRPSPKKREPRRRAAPPIEFKVPEIEGERYTPTRLISRLNQQLTSYIESAYPLSDPILVRTRRKLLEEAVDGRLLSQEPYVETNPRYKTHNGDYSSLGLPKHIGVLLSRLASTKPQYSKPDDSGTLLYPHMWTHQAESFKQFLSEDKDIIVSTGTGSGKTECFLIPILGLLFDEAKGRPQSFELPGVRALILYPMNALVNDQLSRLRLLFGDMSLAQAFSELGGECRHPTFGMYTGRTLYPGPRTASKDSKRVMPLMDYYTNIDPDLLDELQRLGRYPAKDLEGFYAKHLERERIIQSGERKGKTRKEYNWKKRLQTQSEDRELLMRQEMVQGAGTIPGQAPDILVTNYTMLEYMLMRPFERPVFQQTADWLAQEGNQFLLVLDEAHMYQGAKGAEVGFLLRRLRARLGINDRPDKLRVICTSASLGSEKEGLKSIRNFAADLTGKRPDDFVAIIGQREIPPDVATGESQLADILADIDLNHLHAAASPDTLRKALEPVFDYLQHPCAEESEDGVLRCLYQALKGKPFVNMLLKETAGSAQSLQNLADKVFLDHPRRRKAIEVFITLGAIAREKRDSPGLIPTRVHAFFRGLQALYACINMKCPGRQDAPGENTLLGKLFTESRTTCDACGSRVFEIASCRSCGTPYILPYCPSNALDHLDFLWGETEGTLEKIQVLPVGPRYTDAVEEIRVHLKTGYIDLANTFPDEEVRSFWLQLNPEGEREFAFRRCAMCQSPEMTTRSRIFDFQTRGEQAFTALIEAQFSEQPPQKADPRLPNRGRKVLVFSDGRQKAARLAPALEYTHARDIFRQILAIAGKELEDQTSFKGMDKLYPALLWVCNNRGINLFPGTDEIEFREHLRRSGDKSIEQLIQDFNQGFLRPTQSYAQQLFSETVDRYYSLNALALATVEEDPVVRSMFDDFPNVGLEEEEIYVVYRNWLRLQLEQRRFLPQGADISKLGEGWEKPFGIDIGKRIQIFPRPFEGYLREIFSEEAADQVEEWFISFIRGKGLLRFENDQYFLQPMGLSLNLKLDAGWLRCGDCSRIYAETLQDLCPACLGKIVDADPDYLDARTGFYRQQVLRAFDVANLEPFGLVTAEHSAQLTGRDDEEAFNKTEIYELRFQDIQVDDEGPIDVLSCTTTMEVGIDIGTLSGVALRNVPPHVANYQQRAGRAGRRGRSIASVITYAHGTSHDAHFYQNPEKIISGAVRPPVVYIENQQVLRRHINAYLVQRFFHETVTTDAALYALFESLGTVEQFLSDAFPCSLKKLDDWLRGNTRGLLEELRHWAPAFSYGLDEEIKDISTTINASVDELIKVLYEALPVEEYEKREDLEGVEREVIERQLEERLLDTLIGRAIFPRYAFPTDVVAFWVSRPKRPGDPAYKRTFDYEPQRDLQIALSEYAPGSSLTIDKYRFTSAALFSPYAPEVGATLERARNYTACNSCGYVSLQEDAQALAECPCCHNSELFKQRFITPEGFAPDINVKRETDRGEAPAFAGRTSRAQLEVQQSPAQWDDYLYDNRVSMIARAQHLVMVNKGLGDRGFIVCPDCGRTEAVFGPGYANSVMMRGGVPRQHHHPLEQGVFCDGHALGPYYMGHRFPTDVLLLRLRFDLPVTCPITDMVGQSGSPGRIALTSLVEAMCLAASQTLQIEEGELSGNWSPVLGGGQMEMHLFLYDLLPGGAGYTRLVKQQIQDVFTNAESLLASCSCETSCYRCLRHYANNIYHASLDRHLALALLRYLVYEDIPKLTEEERKEAFIQFVELLRLKEIAGEQQVVRDGVSIPLVIYRSDGSEIWVDTHHSLIVADQSESDVRALAESEMVEFYSLDAFTLRHDLPNAFAQLQLF
jgi:ATP-dependent helicase YprA (DUF1998 family)